MDPLAFLAYLGGTLLTVALFYGVAIRKSRPVYETSEGIRSKRIESGSIFRLAAGVAGAVGVLLSVIQSFSSAGIDLLGFATVTLTAMVAFLLVVFSYTDHIYRMADRVLLRWGFGMALILGVLRLIELQSESTTVIYAVGILLSFAIMFVPSIGASDARSFMLLFAVGIPVLGVLYTYYAFLVGIGLWLAYGIVAAIATRSFKVSIPLVPYILLPLAIGPIVLSLVYGIPRILEVLSP